MISRGTRLFPVLTMVVLSSLSCLCSCKNPLSTTELPSPTPTPTSTQVPTPTQEPPTPAEGYVLFTGTNERILVSFEYPIDWVIEKEDYVSPYAEVVFSLPGIDAPRHGVIVYSPAQWELTGSGYRLVSENDVYFNGYHGGEGVFFLENHLNVWDSVVYKEQSYSVCGTFASLEEYEPIKPDLDHILATWRFLD